MRVTCAFAPSPSVRHDCEREGIFRREYQRANRMHGIKILRCFPHCCPHHKPRSYCGQSVFVRVVDPRGARHIADMRVFARFRQERSSSMRVGDETRSSDILTRLQSDDAPTAEWFESSSVSHSGHECVFEINPSARWVYAWSSGASKEQRLTTHVFEAVVVRAFQDEDDGSEWFRFLAVTKSPAFTIVSFRRTEESTTDPSLLNHALERDDTQQSPLSAAAALHEDAVPEPSVSLPSWFVPTAVPSRSRLAFVESLQVIYSITTQLPARELVAAPPRWSHRQPMPPVLLERDAVQLATQLVWWLQLTADDVVAALDRDCQLTEWLLDLQAMVELYEAFIKKLQDRCEALLSQNVWSWTALKTALTAATTQRSVSPTCPHPFSWETFIAKARHCEVQRQSWLHFARLPSRRAPSQDMIWTSQADNVQVRDVRRFDRPDHRLDHSVSVGGLFFFWTQLSTLRIRLDEQCLQVSSRTPRLSNGDDRGDTRGALEMILDGRNRIFQTLPNGEPSLGVVLPGGYSIGDYTGSVRDTNSVLVTTFAWPSGHSAEPTAYRWHWAFPVSAAGTQRLQVSVRIEAGRVLSRTPLDTMALHAKLRLVDDWTPAFRGILPYHAVASWSEYEHEDRSTVGPVYST